MIVHHINYPNIFTAFNIIGGDEEMSSRDDPNPWDVPEEFHEQMDRVEETLGHLSPEDLETLCIGEINAAEKIRLRSDGLIEANEFLANFCNIWEDYE